MKQFGDLEARIMDVLWLCDEPLSVRQVLEQFPDDQKRAYTTVMTVLDNLHRKGFLRRERSGRAYLYRPAQSREEHAAALMEELLAGSGDPEGTMLRFVGHLDSEEVSRLRAMLDSLEGSAR